MSGNQQHIKTVNTDSRVKNRLRYASTRERSKNASADVYRSYKRKLGVTTAATREERVHNPEYDSRRKRKKNESSYEKENDHDVCSKTAVLHRIKSKPRDSQHVAHDSEDEENNFDSNSFVEELDIAYNRNASALYGQFYREIWPFVRSLPEILHHADKIITLLLSYILSPEGSSTVPSPVESWKEVESSMKRQSFVTNLATTDILHLLSVLARDLRHEIHPYLHTQIVPRIVFDLLNPPTQIGDETLQQRQTLDITIVESAFRTLSYIFKYDAEEILSEVGNNKATKTDNCKSISNHRKKKQNGCLESMRAYYGTTLANKQDYVRRLAAETFAPLIRKIRNDTGRKKHIRRVLRALAVSSSSGVSVNGEEENSPRTLHSVQRARSNAIDGISLLIFNTIKGVPGHLHSKASSTIRLVLECLVSLDEKSNNKDTKVQIEEINKPKMSRGESLFCPKRKVVFTVISQVLFKIRGYVHDGTNFLVVWDELNIFLKNVLKHMSIDTEVPADLDMKSDVINSVIQLMEECISYRDGYLLKDADEEVSESKYVDELSIMLQNILQTELYDNFGHETKRSILKLFCTSWRTYPSHPGFSSRLRLLFSKIIGQSSKFNREEEITTDAALILSNDLLPYLPQQVAMKYLIPAILTTISSISTMKSLSVLFILHTVVMTEKNVLVGDQAKLIHTDDNIFSLQGIEDCTICDSDWESLINVCLFDSNSFFISDGVESFCAKVGYVARCLPFLLNISISSQSGSKNVDDTNTKRVCSWILETSNLIAKLMKDDSLDKGDKQCLDMVIAQSLLLESVGKAWLKRFEEGKNNDALKKTLRKLRKNANELLFQHPGSLWSIKSVATITKSLAKMNDKLNDSTDDVFDLLIPNLQSPCHFVRLHTLTVINSYPDRPFVTDHADLDLTDDLDEEPSSVIIDGKQDSTAREKSSSVSGTCNLMKTLLQLETTPLDLTNERTLTSEISAIEVLARSGRIPVIYAEAAANHMLGLLYVKFQPLWQVCIRAIISLITQYEENVWPYLESKLKTVMEPTSTLLKNSDNEIHQIDDKDNSISSFHKYCVDWETSKGENESIFRALSSASRNQGHVSRNKFTDALTVFESVWSIMEGIPNITTRKSRSIVPIFLDFLHNQYYLFHDNDYDAKELNLEEHLDIDSNLSQRHCWKKEHLGRKPLQNKLKSFFKMFAAVNGPQQLFKNKLLLTIFESFLSNADFMVAQLSFSCIAKYKLSHINPYILKLQRMLSKKTLRESLVKFNISKENGDVEDCDRKALIPIITRIVFGRLSSRAISTKSSKDSPAARRAAILSFMSTLGKNEGELDFFVYMMLRVFIPEKHIRKIKSCTDGDHLRGLIALATTCTYKDIEKVHTQRVEGFLNLLEIVLSSLGFGVKNYTISFVPLLLTIIEHTEKLRKDSPNHDTKDEDSPLSKDEDSEEYEPLNKRKGIIRNLCYRRLSEIMIKFGKVIDFSPFTERLWSILDPALNQLPGSIMNSEKSPSLLVLLESMSSHSSLLHLLSQHNPAIIAVLKCISPRSRYDVIDRVLKFIDNLLTEGGSIETDSICSERIGASIIQSNLELLIGQISIRLQSGKQHFQIKNDNSDFMINKTSKENKLEWRELNILCRISELISHGKTNEKNEIMEKMCSILMYYLNIDRKISEDSLCDVLKIISRIIPHVSIVVAMTHLQTVSKLLGPKNTGPGIMSLSTRQLVASVIESIANCSNGNIALKLVAQHIEDLSAAHPKHIDEHNFDVALPVLNSLGDGPDKQNSWVYIAKIQLSDQNETFSISRNDGVKVLVPLMYNCIHFLYDEDGVISRGSFNALRMLVTTSAEQAKEHEEKKSEYDNVWTKLIETSLVPCLKKGLKTKNINARRFFLLLISTVAKSFSFYDSPHLYGDLTKLVNDDDPDLDFFLNITHLQIHRRTRALLRLRKMLSLDEAERRKQEELFCAQTFSNILLPVAMHPVYDCVSKSEESYVLESIVTVGSICKHLPWNKYQNTLWTILTQISRFPEKESQLTALLCSVIDAYHFSIEVTDDSEKNTSAHKITENVVNNSDVEESGLPNGHQHVAIWNALKNKLIPKIESLLVKERIERGKDIEKVLCAPIALALIKLFQKLPNHIFISKLPGLLTAVCGSLKNKESNDRDKARETLSKISTSIDIKYLGDIIRELAVVLKGGYQLHVRAATLHSILLSISQTYQRPESISGERLLPFDSCVPAMMDLIQQDIFGIASEMKEAESVKKRVIKEAMGVKSYHTLELISRCIHFDPSDSVINAYGVRTISSVQSLIAPFLERLRDPEIEKSVMGKVKECLNRIVLGLSRNDSANLEKIMPFVYATVAPFVTEDGRNYESDLEDSDEEKRNDIQISKKGSSLSKGNKTIDSKGNNAVRKVFEWNPSSIGAHKDGKSAFEMKLNDKKEYRKVRDGVNAPKLTGKSRYVALKSSTRVGIRDPAGASAVAFGLQLLHSCLKHSKLISKNSEVITQADDFVQLLTTCVRFCNDNIVITFALKCLTVLLNLDLPSIKNYSKHLGGHCLRLLTLTGATSKNQNELIQICFKMLTLLLAFSKRSKISSQTSKLNPSFLKDSVDTESQQIPLPLDEQQMQVLISFLSTAVTDYDHHHATFSLIKSILSTNYISPELYDLMDVLLKLTVQSQKINIQEQARIAFLLYLIEYPMGPQKLENHLKQMILNINYEYEAGRLSALKLIESAIGKIPAPLLYEHTQLFFLPLVLQLVNDHSKQCREAVGACIFLLFKRLSVDSLLSLYEYVTRWAKQEGDESRKLRRTSSQLFGIFIDAREDFIKRGETAKEMVQTICMFLHEELGKGDYTDILMGTDWEVSYFCLICVEKLNIKVPSLTCSNMNLWQLLVKCLAHPHPWIQKISSRTINSHLCQLDLQKLLNTGSKKSFVTSVPGSLFQIARNLCYQLNVDEKGQDESVSMIAIKSLSWVIRAMDKYPNLCFEEENGMTLETISSVTDNDNDSEFNFNKPISWLMMRLSNIAKAHGKKRREAIFKCFAAFITTCNASIIKPYLELMIAPLQREISEVTSKSTPSLNGSSMDLNTNEKPNNADLAQEILHLMEEKCGSEEFLQAMTLVKKKAREKRVKRKQEIALEAVNDPESHAKRKTMRNERKKNNKKRKIEERRKSRGASQKTSRYVG